MDFLFTLIAQLTLTVVLSGLWLILFVFTTLATLLAIHALLSWLALVVFISLLFSAGIASIPFWYLKQTTPLMILFKIYDWISQFLDSDDEIVGILATLLAPVLCCGLYEFTLGITKVWV